MSNKLVFVETYEPLRELLEKGLPSLLQAQGLDCETQVLGTVLELTHIIHKETLEAACVIVDCDESAWHELIRLKRAEHLMAPLLILVKIGPKFSISKYIEANLATEGVHLQEMPFPLSRLVAKIKEIIESTAQLETGKKA